MKKLFVILSIALFTGCQAANLPVRSCTSNGCPRPQTMADTLPESKPWEIWVATGGVVILVILAVSSIEIENEKDK